jgi:hypothetical protein
MSIRAKTSTKQDRARGGARRRTGFPLPRREPDGPSPEPPAPVAPPASGKDLTDERRLRESGGPEDRQLYTCGCGFAWHWAVTASAACPNCGAPQAW